MVTQPDDKDTEPGVPERVEIFAREVIAGDQMGAVRRIVLWVLLVVCIISPLPLLALVPATLLLATDRLV